MRETLRNLISSFFAPERDVLETEMYITSLEEEVRRLKDERSMFQQHSTAPVNMIERETAQNVPVAVAPHWESRELQRDLERVQGELNLKNSTLFKIHQLLNEAAFGRSQ